VCLSLSLTFVYTWSTATPMFFSIHRKLRENLGAVAADWG